MKDKLLDWARRIQDHARMTVMPFDDRLRDVAKEMRDESGAVAPGTS